MRLIVVKLFILVILVTSCTDITIPSIPSLNKNIFYSHNYKVSNYSIVTLCDNLAKKFSFDTNLLLALIKQESGFNPNAKSKAGAIGLMQLMPSAISDINSYSYIKIVDPTNIYQNIEGGTWFLNRIYQQFFMYPNRWKYTLSAYNCGVSCVKTAERIALENYKKLKGYKPMYLDWDYIAPYLPFETQNYVPAIEYHYKVFSNPKLELKINKSKAQITIINKSNFPVILRNYKIKDNFNNYHSISAKILFPNQLIDLDKALTNVLLASSSPKLTLVNTDNIKF